MNGDDWRPLAKVSDLQWRGELVWEIRQFFHAAGYVEVHTPTLSRDTVIDRYIDPVVLPGRALGCFQGESERYFLQTSPEFGMKRLLAAGMRAIYQLGPAFRAGERGAHHNPEFTMLEWYQVDQPLAEALAFLAQLVDRVLVLARRPHGDTLGAARDGLPGDTGYGGGVTPCRETGHRDGDTGRRNITTGRGDAAIGDTGRGDTAIETYQSVFMRLLGIDPLESEVAQLERVAQSHQIELGSSWADQTRDDWLNLLFAECIQPRLGFGPPMIITHYPATQAALAGVCPRDSRVAERYELFIDGVEIANGYHELLDPAELAVRNDIALQQRRQDKKEDLPSRSRLLAAMQAGMPDACGCALGVDRLIMIALGHQVIDSVIPFGIERA